MRRSHLAVLIITVFVGGALSAAPGAAVSEQAGAGSGWEDLGAAVESASGARKIHPSDLDITPWVVEGELLVKFRRGVSRSEARGVHVAQGARLLDRIKGFGGIDLVRLPDGLAVADAVAAYQRDPSVAIAEPNLRREYHTHIPGPPPTLPDDTFFSDLWGLHNTGQPHAVSGGPDVMGTAGADINAPEAWVTEQGDTSPTIIGVADSGVDVTHPEFAGQLWVNTGEVVNGLDDDGNGCIDDVNGCNFGPGADTNLSDSVPPHGTHVAGTIAAAGHNTAGVVGVCPHCQIMVLKLGAPPTLAAELAAFDYARTMGADIINGSFGGPFWSNLERNKINGLKNAGILAVFSSANDALDNDMLLVNPLSGFTSPIYPASYILPNILSVAASNHHDQYGYSTACDMVDPRQFCAFTNIGHDSVDVAAPGVDILSTFPADSYGVGDGTSFAAPHAAGVAGLLKAANPARGPVQIKNAIMNSADRVPSLNTAWSPVFRGGKATGKFTRTNGRIDAADALAETDLSSVRAGPRFSEATPKTDGNIDGAARLARVKRGRVAYPHDINDVYKRRFRKGKEYEIRLDVPRGKDYDLWVWKPKTKEIWQLETACAGGGRRCKLLDGSFKGKGKDEVITFVAPTGGRYYIQVEAWLKHAGRYKLTVTKIS